MEESHGFLQTASQRRRYDSLNNDGPSRRTKQRPRPPEAGITRPGGILVELQQLESFIAVARLGSFTRAAKDRHRTQSGVSRHVQQLELELGVPLVIRRRGGGSLTEAGQRLLLYAEETVARHKLLLEELRSFAHAINGAAPFETGRGSPSLRSRDGDGPDRSATDEALPMLPSSAKQVG